MSGRTGSKKIEEALDTTAGKGMITNKAKSIVVANLEATLLPSVIGASVDTGDLGTTTPAAFKLVVDASGSMSFFEWAMIDALNAISQQIKDDQQKTGAEVLMSLSQFDDRVRLIRGFEDILTQAPFGAGDYMPGGMTALCDGTFNGLTELLAFGATLFSAGATGFDQSLVVMSDGQDNSSGKTPIEVKSLLVEAQSKPNFVAAFIGFGSENEFRPIAEEMGFLPNNIRTYDPSDQSFLEVVARAVSSGVSQRSKRAAGNQQQSGDFFLTNP